MIFKIILTYLNNKISLIIEKMTGDALITITTNDGEDLSFDSYEDMVSHLAEYRIDYTFGNGLIGHSIMLIKEFMKNINGTLKLYTRNFKKDIFDSSDLIFKMIEFIKRKDGNKIQILIEDKREDFTKEKSNFLKSLEEFLQNKKIQIKTVNSDKKCQQRYMVLDTAYRFANNQHDDENFSASVNFNHTEHSSILNKHFDNKFKNQSQDIQWT